MEKKTNTSKKDKNQFRSRTLGTRKKTKTLTKGILKKKANESESKKGLEVKIINDKEKEESINEKIKKNEREDDFRPLSENEKQIEIVDYIIEKVPNLIEIINGLFNKGVMDICSLTIMFCCNLIRKIRFSKYKEIQSELIKCVDNYIKNEPLLNTNDNEQTLLNTDSGKFLYISIIKYFICLNIENIEEFLINNLQNSTIIEIIMNNMKEENSSNLKRIKHFKLTLNDIRENTLNFALVDNQLNLINLILLLIKQKDIKYFFGYKSQNEIREYIGIFYEEFMKNFSTLIVNLKKDDEEQKKLNEMNKLELIKRESEEEDESNSNSDEYSNNKSFKKEKVNKNNEEEGIISKNQTIQNILISSLKILIEFYF